MATNDNNKFEEHQSRKFIRKVMASNSADISKAGYFYKWFHSTNINTN